MLTTKLSSYITGIVAASAIFSAVAQGGLYNYATSPSATDFAQEKVVGSAPIPVTVTITNTFAYKNQLGFGATIVGDANWQQTSSTCQLGIALAYGASCVIKGVYTPMQVTKASTLTLLTTVGAGMRGQQTILHTVVKNGSAAPELAVAWTKALPATTSLDTTYTVEATVTNTGATAVTLAAPIWSGTPAEDFPNSRYSSNCTNSLDAGKSCIYSQTFKPVNASMTANDKKLDITINYNTNQTVKPAAPTTSTTHPTWVAVGSGPGNNNNNGARILVSKDQGRTWKVNSYNDITGLSSIIANPSQLLALGNNGAAMTSSTGDEWIKRNTSTNYDLLSGIWDNDQYSVYGVNSNNDHATMLSSLDGQNWIIKELSPLTGIISILKRDNSYVALAIDTNLNTLFLTSNDGVSWKETYNFTTQQKTVVLLSQLIWDGTHYIAIGYSAATNSAVSYKSTNGINWVVYPIPETPFLFAVNWNGLQYVAVGEKGTVLTSTDAQTWTVQQSHVQGDLNKVTWDGSQYLVVGAGTMIKSADGINWSVLNSGGSFHLNSVAWNGASRYVAVGGHEYNISELAPLLSVSGIITSTDGVNWKQVTSVPSNAQLKSVAYGNGVFVAVGVRGTILRSTDGLIWDQIERLNENNLNEVIWSADRNKFFVVGDNGGLYTSPDGIQWSSITIATVTTDDLYRIAEKNNGCLLSVEWSRTLFKSDNCQNQWRQINLEFLVTQLAVIDDKFIALGASGQVASSTDGSDWETHKNAAATILYDIAKLGDNYLVITDKGKIYKSANLDSWSQVDLQNTMQLNAILVANNQATVVGNRGVIYNSNSGTTWTAAQNFNIHLNDVYAKLKSSS